MISQDIERELPVAAAAVRPRRWPWFVAVGALLFAALYGASEWLVLQQGQRSRLFMVATAGQPRYDLVVLGASHALPFDFGDMNARLEQATGARILNLSVEGGGLVPARFMLDYFLSRHETRAVLYVVDSFAFRSAQWNEDRIADPKLLARAPLDPALAAALWRQPETRGLLPGYLTGFYKINNADRLEPDVGETERSKWTRVYRANATIDRQRLSYLYPANPDPAALERYLAAFDRLAGDLKARGIRLIALKTPLPARVLGKLPGEEDFDARVRAILERHGFALHDFTREANDDAFFYDTDHLNRDGVVTFMDRHLVPLLTEQLAGDLPRP